MYHRHGTAAMPSESDISCLWQRKEESFTNPGFHVFMLECCPFPLGCWNSTKPWSASGGIFVTAMLKLTSIRWWRFVPQKLKCSWEWCHFLVGEQSDRCTVRALLKWQLACSLCFRLFFGRIVNTFFGHVRFAYSMSKPDMNLPRKWLSDGFLNWISIPVVGSQKYIKVW